MRFIHVTLHVRPDKVEIYERTFLDLQRQVRENEPECRLLELCRDPAEPFVYHVLEAYDDETAVEHHVNTEYYMETANIFITCLKGDHMDKIKSMGLKGKEMYSIVENINFSRMETI